MFACVCFAHTVFVHLPLNFSGYFVGHYAGQTVSYQSFSGRQSRVGHSSVTHMGLCLLWEGTLNSAGLELTLRGHIHTVHARELSGQCRRCGVVAKGYLPWIPVD